MKNIVFDSKQTFLPYVSYWGPCFYHALCVTAAVLVQCAESFLIGLVFFIQFLTIKPSFEEAHLINQ